MIALYLADKIHFLAENFNFSNNIVRSIVIQSLNEQGSKVICQNASGFYFRKKEMVEISHIHFENCNNKPMNSALYFGSVDLVVLSYISVTNSSGNGYRAYECKDQVIQNSVFESNKGNSELWFSAKRRMFHATINITNTSISSGIGNYFYGGGVNIQIPSFVRSSINIENCTFNNNTGRKGSQLSITVKSERRSKIAIIKCLFTTANGPEKINTYGVAIVVEKAVNYIEVVHV